MRQENAVNHTFYPFEERAQMKNKMRTEQH